MRIKGLVVLLLSLSFATHANFTPTDWKVQGDGLATLDHATGIEWLDVKVTHGMSIDSVIAKLDTTYLGWRLPTQAEVSSMMRRFFTALPEHGAPEQLVWNVTASQLEHELFTTLFGGTYGPWYSYGSYLGSDGVTVYSSGSGGTGARTSSKVYINYTRGNSRENGDGFAGVFLVSDGGVTLSSLQDPTLNINNPNAPVNTTLPSVDVPVSFGISGALLLALAGLRRKHWHY